MSHPCVNPSVGASVARRLCAPGIAFGGSQSPRNAKLDAGRLAASSIPPSNLWDSDSSGDLGQLRLYRLGLRVRLRRRHLRPRPAPGPATNGWTGDPSHSHDSIVKRSGDRFTDLVKRTYRVLLTRGLKGCYVLPPNVDARDMLLGQIRSDRWQPE